MATPSTSLELTLRGRVLMLLGGLAVGAAWLGGDTTARLAAAMLTAPLVVDFVAKQRGLHHTRLQVGDRRTVAGAVYRETVVVEHLARRPLRECLLLEPDVMRSEPPAQLPTLRPGQPERITLRQRSAARGHDVERVFLLVSGWPLGLWTTNAVVVVQRSLITTPARVSLPPSVLQAADANEHEQRARSPREGSEFHALREHHLDEDARGVHALRSAAVGALVRRVTRGRTPHRVGVVVDLRRPRPLGWNSTPTRLEWHLGAAATLIEAMRARGADVRVAVLTAEPEVIDVRDANSCEQVMTVLAEVESTPFRALAPELLAQLQQLAHCYWIPAGGNPSPAEARQLRGGITFVRELEA